MRSSAEQRKRLHERRKELYPLASQRGIETTDLNDLIILVHAPIEQVASTFRSLYPIHASEEDIYGREIEVSKLGILLCQLRGHAWTLLHEIQQPLSIEDAQRISSILPVRVIFFIRSDTSAIISYAVYEYGQEVEMLYLDESDNQVYSEIESEFPFRPQRFFSQLRPKDLSEIDDAYEFTQDFIRQQDAYVPDSIFLLPPEHGSTILVGLSFGNRDIDIDEIKRLDCFSLLQG